MERDMNDISKLPRWVQEKIAELEQKILQWEERYVKLSESMVKKDPVFNPLVPPAEIKVFPPGPIPPTEPPFQPGVYAYMAPFPKPDIMSGQTAIVTSSEIVLSGTADLPPTENEP
jgi:hypothetical protein